MKILAIGDPHGNLDEVKKVPLKNTDLIVMNGDLGRANLMRNMAFENIKRQKQGLPKKEFTPAQEKRAFMEAYTSTIKLMRYLSKFAPVYTIFGNVESSNHETRMQSKRIGTTLPYLSNNLNAMDNVRVINNKVASVGSIRIGGLEYFVETNWVKEFQPSDKKKLTKAEKETEKAKKALRRFGTVDVLLCHQPPYGVLDKVNFPGAPKHWKNKHAGSKIILDYIKRKQPKYVFCGHIHEGKGTKRIGKTTVHNLGVNGYKIITL